VFFFFSSRRRHTRSKRDWSSDVCSSDLSEVKEDEQIYYEDGFYHLTNINHVFDSLQIRNGKTVSEHRFVWKQKGKQRKQVYLNDYVDEGAWFTLKIEKLSLLDLLREVKIHE